MVKSNAGIFIFRDIHKGFIFDGCGYLESQITLISKGKYKITIKYHTDGEEKLITISSKGLSRITLNVDRFEIVDLYSESGINMVVNNIKDYFFDLLSEN